MVPSLLVTEFSKYFDICWDLRMQPSLNLYLRAFINILIAYAASFRVHSDKTKFAHDAIALCHLPEREGLRGPQDGIDNIKTHARWQLEDTEAEIAEVESLDKEQAGELSEVVERGTDMKSADVGEQSSWSTTGKEMDTGCTVEGMYEDRGDGLGQGFPSPIEGKPT